MTQPQAPLSPSWGTNTKLVVALTIVVIVGALLVEFQFVITPLLIALVMSYLFHPVAGFIQRKVHLSWSASVGVIYIVIAHRWRCGVGSTNTKPDRHHTKGNYNPARFD